MLELASLLFEISSREIVYQPVTVEDFNAFMIS
mgnify:CR=1 FL=1